MSQGVETLGVARVDIRSALLKAVRGEWAYIRVPVGKKGVRSNSLEIVDNRAEVVVRAEEVFAVSAQINEAKRQRASQAEPKRRLSQALQTFQKAFQSPAIVSVQEQVTVGGGESYQRILLHDASEDECEAVLDVIRTYGRWNRDPRSLFQPIYANRSREMALHVIFANGDGVTIWDLREKRVYRFEVSFPEGRHPTRTYEEVSAESESEEEEPVAVELVDKQVDLPPDESTESESVETETTEPVKKTRKKASNSKIETECLACGSSVTVKSKDLAAGTAKCPECDTILTSED